MKTRPHAATTAIARKHSAKLWTDDDARLAAPRGSPHALPSALHVRALQEVFPSLERAVLQDVLVAARCQVDVAAAMLGELVRESISLVRAPETPTHLQQEELPLDFDMIAADDDEDWSEVSAVVAHQSHPLQDSQSWVMLHDEWEVVGMDGERVLSFAEMLRRAGANEPRLPALRIVAHPTSRAAPRAVKQKLATPTSPSEAFAFDGAEQSVKSFGTRKRRHLKSRA